MHLKTTHGSVKAYNTKTWVVYFIVLIKHRKQKIESKHIDIYEKLTDFKLTSHERNIKGGRTSFKKSKATINL